MQRQQDGRAVLKEELDKTTSLKSRSQPHKLNYSDFISNRIHSVKPEITTYLTKLNKLKDSQQPSQCPEWIITLEKELAERKQNWKKLSTPSASDLMKHFIALNPISEQISQVKEQETKELKQTKPLRIRLDRGKLKTMLPACFTSKKDGKVEYGGRALGEIKVEMQNQEEEKKAPKIRSKPQFKDHNFSDQKLSVEEREMLAGIINQSKQDGVIPRGFEVKPEELNQFFKFKGISALQGKSLPGDPGILTQPFGNTESLIKFNLQVQIYTSHGINDIIFPKNAGCCHFNNSTYIAGGNFDTNAMLPCDFFYQIYFHGGRRMRSSLPTSRSHLSLVSLSSKSLVASGGKQGANSLPKVEKFFLALQNWVSLPSLNYARSSHASTGFQEYSVIVFLGLGAEKQNINSMERWSEGQTFWTVLNLSDDSYKLQGASCLRAIEIKEAEIILWSKSLDSNAVFRVKQESEDCVKVERIAQEDEVPNCNHGSAVKLYNSTLYAYDQHERQLFELQGYQFKIKNMLFLEPKAFGI